MLFYHRFWVSSRTIAHQESTSGFVYGYTTFMAQR